MTHLLTIHSWFRWVILALGIAGIVLSFYQRSGTGRERAASAVGIAFLAALDTQWLLGVILAVASGLTTSSVVLHGAVMTFAVALAHALRRMARNMPSGRILVYRFLAPVVVILAGHVLLVS